MISISPRCNGDHVESHLTQFTHSTQLDLQQKLNIFVIFQEDIIYGQNHKFLTGKSVNFQKLYLKINKNLQQETSPKISMKL